MRKILFLILTVGSPVSAMAYVGPGMGAGAIGVIVGLVTSILLALFALFWYPAKRVYRRWFPAEPEAEQTETEAPATASKDIETSQ